MGRTFEKLQKKQSRNSPVILRDMEILLPSCRVPRYRRNSILTMQSEYILNRSNYEIKTCMHNTGRWRHLYCLLVQLLRLIPELLERHLLGKHSGMDGVHLLSMLVQFVTRPLLHEQCSRFALLKAQWLHLSHAHTAQNTDIQNYHDIRNNLKNPAKLASWWEEGLGGG